MGSTRLRSFVKGLIWEVSMFALATLVIWAAGMSFVNSLKVNLFILGFKIILYYLNERLWKKIKWGKA